MRTAPALLSLLNKTLSNSQPRYSNAIGGKGIEHKKFSEPSGIYCDEMGSLYAADTGNKRIQKINQAEADGTIIGRPKKGEDIFKRPVDVWVDRGNNIYVIDVKLFKVYKFDENGNPVFTFGKEGKKDGEFKEPSAIAVDYEGYIYVLDKGNKRYTNLTGQEILSSPLATKAARMKDWMSLQTSLLTSRGISLLLIPA